MKILRPIESISTSGLLDLVATMYSLSFTIAMIGGLVMGLLLSAHDESLASAAIIAGCAILLLLFYVLMNRYVENRIVLEIKRRCADSVIDS